MSTITTTWVIEYMNTSTQTINGFTEVVLTAGWRCNGTDGTNYASSYGSSTFTPPQAGDPNFTPYANLTQAQVLGWVWASGVNQQQIETAVTGQVEILENPPVTQPPLPWAPPAPSATATPAA
jgi:hypothetical protein